VFYFWHVHAGNICWQVILVILKNGCVSYSNSYNRPENKCRGIDFQPNEIWSEIYGFAAGSA